MTELRDQFVEGGLTQYLGRLGVKKADRNPT